MNFGFVVILIVVSAFLGKNRPLIGAVAGCVLTLLLFFLFEEFAVRSFVIALAVGFSISIGSAFLFHFMAAGHKGGSHNTGPSVWGLGSNRIGGSGFSGNQPNMIIPTDEEQKHQKK